MSDTPATPEPVPPAPRQEPIPSSVTVNNGPTLTTLILAFSVSSLVTAALAVGGFAYYQQQQNQITEPVVTEPVKVLPDLVNSLARKNGIRMDSVKPPLVELVKAGVAEYTLHFQPDGQPEVTWKILVTGGGEPAPVQPPKPDEPLPRPPPATPVDPSTKVTAVTYIYEKDTNGVPNFVQQALNKINRDSKFEIVATIFEDDNTTGQSSVPKQYQAAYEAAKKEGLPAVVVSTKDRVKRVLKAPKTEAEILEAAK